MRPSSIYTPVQNFLWSASTRKKQLGNSVYNNGGGKISAKWGWVQVPHKATIKQFAFLLLSSVTITITSRVPTLSWPLFT